MRWRPGVSLLTVLTAAIAVAAAVLGPMYQHTASDSVLRRTIATADVQTGGVLLQSYRDRSDPLGRIQRAERVFAASTRAGGWFGQPITTVQTGATVYPAGERPTSTELFARSGLCRVLHFRAGGCSLGPDEAVVSIRTARQLHLRVGGPIRASAQEPLKLTVTGIYDVPDLNLSYWWGDGQADFPFGVSSPQSGPQTDPLIVSPATALAVPARAVPTAMSQIPLRAGSVDLHNEPALRHALTGIGSTLNRQEIRVGSQLPSVLDRADHQRHVMATIVAIAAIQLVLLAVWVLGSLLVRSSEARRAEARVAQLRGFPAISMLWVTAAEPALLCVLGALIGVAAAWGSIVLARAKLFVPASTIAFDGWTFAALGLTLVAIFGALSVGTLRLLRSASLSDSPIRTTRRASPLSLVADVVLVVLAIVALVALATSGALSGRPDPIASAAPGLIALGAAVLAVQVILFACRIGVSLSSNSKRVGAFLAMRQTVRRPGVLRQARVLVVALCLACFATAAWSVARSNRSTAARFQVGADTVVTVAPVATTKLQGAVERVDPDRRFAMAAVELQTASSSLLAVDATRLPLAASWPRGISRSKLSEVARALRPTTAPMVRLPDQPVRVRATTMTSVPAADVDLALWVSSDHGATIVNLGRLHTGQWTYRADLSGECAGGCRLDGVGLVPAARRTPPPGGMVTVLVDGLWSQTSSAVRRPAAADLDPGGWRAAAGGVQLAFPHAHVLELATSAQVIASEAGATASAITPLVTPADHPRIIPAAVTSELESLNDVEGVGTLPTQALDGNSIDVRPVVRSSAMPRLGADAVMVDLGLVSDVQVGPTSPDATDEVWLGPRTPAGAVAELRSAGLDLTGVDRSAAVFQRLQRTGPALADDFLLVATLAALLIAAASTLAALGATTRERATELSSLEVLGVRRPVLIRALGLESAILALTALCGVGAGVLAALLAVPSLPELTTATLAPLHHGLPAGLIAAVSVLVIALILLAAGAVAAVLLHRMSPALLRTAPDDVSG